MNDWQTAEILAVYRKHGWHLHSVLLTGKLKFNAAEIFGDAEMIKADVDAAWFTRDSGKTRVAWELRHLSETPFALFESFEKDTDEAEIKETKAEMELRLAKLVAKRNN